MKRIYWTRAELVVALNLYFRLPFGQLHSHNPEIMHLAELLGRTPSSIAMRLSNFAACDPFHINRGVKGLQSGVRVCMPIWKEFEQDKEKLIFESESILAALEDRNLFDKYEDLFVENPDLLGSDVSRMVLTRVNQQYFRKICPGKLSQ